MVFDEKNVKTKWDYSLDGKEGYFSDYINSGTNCCLKQYVINENEGMFGKIEYSGNPYYPFSGCKYFYPIPEIKTEDTEKDNAEIAEVRKLIGGDGTHSLCDEVKAFILDVTKMQCSICAKEHTLTKREQIAAYCLNGILSSGNNSDVKNIEKMSINYADELIKALKEDENE